MKNIRSAAFLLFALMLLCSCSTTKTIGCGSFGFDCPKDLELVITDAKQLDNCKEIQNLYYCDGLSYDRDYVFDNGNDCTFDITLTWFDNPDGNTIEEISNSTRTALLKDGGIWTVFATIKSTKDNIIFKASPNHTDILDYGVRYYRFYEKDDGIVIVNAIIREDAVQTYEDSLIRIIASVK